MGSAAATEQGPSGSVSVASGEAASGPSGEVRLSSGASETGPSGSVTVGTDDSGEGDAGAVHLGAGASKSAAGDGGEVRLNGGATDGGGASVGGSVQVAAGSSAAGSGGSLDLSAGATGDRSAPGTTGGKVRPPPARSRPSGACARMKAFVLRSLRSTNLPRPLPLSHPLSSHAHRRRFRCQQASEAPALPAATRSSKRARAVRPAARWSSRRAT